jgi:hypothetical protein
MTGSLLELVAKGVEDIYLIGNPQITLFLAVYRRVTNFSMYDYTNDLKGCDFSKKFKLKFENMGDLLHKIWFVVDIPQISLTREKATFNYISKLLSSYDIHWSYNLESSTSLVTLDTYNGNSFILTSDNMEIENVNFDEIPLTLTLKIGHINIGSNVLKVCNGSLILEYNVNQVLNLPLDINVIGGFIKISTNSNFGNIYPITSGSITLNNLDDVYFISNVNLVSELNKTIMKTINSKITSIMENYNLYTTAKLISSNSDVLIYNSIYNIENSTIQEELISGRNVFMHIIKTILTKYYYAENIINIPKNDNIYDNNIQLYSNNVKNTMLNYGYLLGAIQNYSYDTSIYNSVYYANQIVIINSYGNIYRVLNGALTDIVTITLSNNLIDMCSYTLDFVTYVICDDGGNIYLFSDFTNYIWETINIGSISIISISSNNDGTIQMCIDNQNNIYMTFDYWSTWTIYAIQLISNDSLLYINNSTTVSTFGSVYVFMDINSGWVLKQNLNLINNSVICGLSMSLDTNIQTIISNLGDVFVSTNKWNSILITKNTGIEQKNIYISNDGTRQEIIDMQGNIYISLSNWNSWSYDISISNSNISISNGNITSLSIIDPNGLNQICIDDNSNIYTSSFYGTKWEYTFNLNTNNIIKCISKNIENTIYNLENSNSIFGNKLKRSSDDINEIVKFNIYNSDDIRMLFYVTFLNNILIQKIVITPDEMIQFNPLYCTTLKNLNILMSNDGIKLLEPSNTSLYDLLLFYHIIDPNVINYLVYPYDKDSNTDIYFDNSIGNNYELYDNYNKIIGGNRLDHTITDSYKIYKSYMKDVMSDIVNNTIKSSQQVNLLATSLKYNIDFNIRYNFNQLLNNMTVLTNAVRTNISHYILSFYRQYTQSISTYVSTSSTSFTSIISNSSLKLADNFKNILLNLIKLDVPNGVKITNYFNDYITNQISNFITSCQNLLRSTNYDDYTNDFKLWSQILVTSGSSILSAYNIVNTVYPNYPIINATIFGKISLMNYIPLLVAKHIPVMVYKTFLKYGKQIMIDIGLDTVLSSSNYDNFMLLIDLRDNDKFDRIVEIQDYSESVKQTKLEIYNKIILSTILTSYDDGATYVLDNSEYFSQLQIEKATGQNVLLTCALRPDTYLCQYSTSNLDGNLIDISVNPLDMTYMPIEWLTQTYYHILLDKINLFIDGLITNDYPNKYGKKILKSVLGNIINCFILRSDMPLYSNYTNNNYSLLGLVDETNSMVQIYKKTQEPVTQFTPLYCDAISSIWYQSQKGMIQMYNNLFNNVLMSSKYFYNNIGNTMGLTFDYIKKQLTDDDNVYYYQNGNTYPTILPDSLTDIYVDIYKVSYSSISLDLIDVPSDDVITKIVNFVGDIYPAVDTQSETKINMVSNLSSYDEGFNFYRMNVGILSDTSSKTYKINAFIRDYILLYKYLISSYESLKKLTLIKNDVDVLNMTNGTKRTIKFKYNKSVDIIDLISNHINITYINPIIDLSIKNNMITLNNNVSIYYNPDISDKSIYGVLDVIYNENFDGSVKQLLNNMITIPNNKIHTDIIDITQNPFTSYFMRLWYENLNENLTYDDIIEIHNLLNNKLYDDLLNEKITSDLIIKNKFLGRLYTKNGSSFKYVEYIGWFLFDLIVTDLNSGSNVTDLNGNSINSINSIDKLINSIQNNTSVKFNQLLFTNNISSISSNDNGAIETLQNLITNYFTPNINNALSKFNLITKFKSSVNLDNGYYDISDENNNDIWYYQYSQNGTPILNMPLEIRLFNLISGIKPKYAWAKELGHILIKKMSISVGGQTIDTYTPELTHLYHNITQSVDHERGYNQLIGNTSDMYEYTNIIRTEKKLYIPCNFWFCKNIGNALPMVNLLYTDIIFSGEINDLTNLLYIEPDSIFKKIPKIKCGVMSRYVYLDDDERQIMAETKLEYLIEKFNYSGVSTFSQNNIFSYGANITKLNDLTDFTDLTASMKVKINMNDSVKYFIWCMKFRDKTTEEPIDILNWNEFGYNVRNSDSQKISINSTIENITLDMNGVYREGPHGEMFYNELMTNSKCMGHLNKGEYVYSFSLYPLLLQPSGTANYSQIQDSYLIIKFTKQIETLFSLNPNLEVTIEIWGCVYNIFRCTSGMAGLVFYRA